MKNVKIDANKLSKDIDTFDKYLQLHKVIQGAEFTHTAFGPPFGSYYIPDSDLDEFYDLYCNIVGQVPLYITERPVEHGPLLIDIDFNFDEKGFKRRYTIDNHVKAVVAHVNKILRGFFCMTKSAIMSYVMEKNKPTVKEDRTCKDGFHIVYPCLALDKGMRYLVLDELKQVLEREGTFDDLGCTNSIDDIVDTSIVCRNGWMMYGSRKHKCQLYKLTHVYAFDLIERGIEDYTRADLARLFSNRKYNSTIDYSNTVGLKIKDSIDEDDVKRRVEYVLDKYEAGKNKRKAKTNVKQKEQDQKQDNDTNKNQTDKESDEHSELDTDDKIKLQNIKNTTQNGEVDIAKKLVDLLSIKRSESYYDWIRVCWALSSVSTKLIGKFKEFSKRCPKKYDEAECEKEWEKAKLRVNEPSKKLLTISSLHMWAQKDNPKEYVEMMRKSINQLFIDAETGTEWDIAQVLYALYKHCYRCSSIEHKTWYEYQGHHWVEIESGHTLYKKISKELISDFASLNSIYYKQLSGEDGQERDTSQKKALNIQKIMTNLKKSGFKSRIMTECAHLFIDSKFEEKLDSNRDLLGFDNGVFDLKDGKFREGSPDDYITFSVGYDYEEYNMKHPYVGEINAYFAKVQRDEIMREYVLTLLASYLDGHNKQQKFIIWTGRGCHAKGTKILMYDGTIKNVEDIQVGDKLMGNDSTPRTVGKLFRGTDRMYEIKQTYNESYVVNSEHRLMLMFTGFDNITKISNNKWKITWAEFDEKSAIRIKNEIFKASNELDAKQLALKFLELNKKNNDNIINKGHTVCIKVKDYLKLSSNIKQLLTGVNTLVEFPAQTVTLDPWALGYWLGSEKLDDENITDKLEKYDLINNKRVPNEYKHNSRDVRLRLLAGFLDATHFKLMSKSEVVLNDMIYVARSLGYAANKLEIKGKCKINMLYHAKMFETYYNFDDIPTIQNFSNTCDKIKNKIKVKNVGYDKYYGFSLDGNECYLMGDFTATYNSNGKSKTMDFFKMAIGDYAGSLPITVLTKKRGASNAATPEMAGMRGKRFVVFQEPENDDVICVGYMKELSGGDEIHARALFKAPIKFIPQFKMLLTCNKLPTIPAGDGGTWRRLRVTPWESQFVDVDDDGTYDGKPLKDFQFPKDNELDEKFVEWKKVFMWMLLKRYVEVYKKKGIKEPEKVKKYTNKYKKASDVYLEFLDETTEKCERDKYESLGTLYIMFRHWYKESYADSKCPSKKDLQQYLKDNDYKVKLGNVLGLRLLANQEAENELDQK